MPLPKPYPPTDISYQDWDTLADHYAGRPTTVLVDRDGYGDYTTIQAAVDVLSAQGSSNMGEILVAKGEYVEAIRIDGLQDLVIRGVGKGTRIKTPDKIQRSLTVDAASDQRDVTCSDGSVFSVGQMVCVRDDSEYEVNRVQAINGNVLTLYNALAHTYEVSDNAIVYTCPSAIYVTGASSRIRITNLLVDGNRLNQTFNREGYYPNEHQGDGIRISATCTSILVDHCWIKSTIAHGVCMGGVGNRVVSNEVWDCGYDGINAEPSVDEILITNNYSHDHVSWNGIQFGYNVHSCGNGVIIGNVCENNRQGIAAQGGHGVQIVGNLLKNNREDGIELYSMDRFTVEGNVITGADDVSDMTNEGIHVEQACSIGTIANNLIELCAGDGIYIESGAYLTVTGNTIRKVAKHGIKVAQTNGRDSTITGNSLVDCDAGDTGTYSGIAILGDRIAVVGNRVDNCDHYFIHLTATSNKCLVVGNQLTPYSGAPPDDVLVDEGAGNAVEHNVVA